MGKARRLTVGSTIYPLGILLVLLAGCATFKSGPPTIGPDRLSYQQVDDSARNLADTYMQVIAEACEQVLAATDERNIQERVLAMRSGTAQSTIILASGANPLANLMDLAVMCTLRRQSLEEYWVPQVLGEVARPIADASVRGKREIWSELDRVLTPTQIDELRAEIAEWRADHPDDWFVGTTGLRNIAIERSESGAIGGKAPGSIFSLMFLDPFASLDPAARQVELSRRFADRAMFALQRQPIVLSWQAEQFLAAAATRSTGATVIAGIEDVAASSRRFAEVAESFPAEIDRQRDAALEGIRNERETAIEQLRESVAVERAALLEGFFDRLTAEREETLAQLADEEGAILAASSDLRETIRSGTELSESLKGSAAAIDALVARFETPESAADGPSMTTEDLREILASSRLTAEQLTVLAERVERIVASPDLQARIDESDALLAAADTRLRDTIDYAFARLTWLVVIAGVVAVGTGLSIGLLLARIGRRVP